MSDKISMSTFELFKRLPDQESARKYLESHRWPDGVKCTGCGLSKRITVRKDGYFRCNQCKEDFTVRTDTIFERSHVPLHKWLYAMYLLVTSRKGISSMQLSKEIGITQKSAWFVLQRLNEAFGNDPTMLQGSVEMDDKVVGIILAHHPKGNLKKVEVQAKLQKPVTRKYRILDLFCCAGGAAKGYQEAGFEVVGVDIDPQPHYPYQFIKADALTLSSEFLATFDAIHASPPCQSYSDLAKRNGNADAWPRLIDPVREMLVRTGSPYVIENVEGAPLRNPVVLCGTMFPGLRVLRHRLFETNFPVTAPPHGKHPKVHTFDKRKSHYGKTDDMVDFVQVTGGGNCTIVAARDAMGIQWMNKGELNEAIPPAYTKHIGKQLKAYILQNEEVQNRRQRKSA